MSDKLKPCPFCGQSATGVDEFRSAYCEICGANGPLEPDDTLRLWNTRPIDDDLRRQLDQARAEIESHRRNLEYWTARCDAAEMVCEIIESFRSNGEFFDPETCRALDKWSKVKVYWGETTWYLGNLRQQIAAAEQRVRELEKQNSDYINMCLPHLLKERAEAAEQRVRELEAALKQYADPSNWLHCENDHGTATGPDWVGSGDVMQIATDALMKGIDLCHTTYHTELFQT